MLKKFISGFCIVGILMACLFPQTVVFADDFSGSGEPVRQVTQKSITEVNAFPNNPAPYSYMDWKQRAIDYDTFVYDWNKSSEFPTIQWDTTHYNLPYNTYKMPSYYGDIRLSQDGEQEAVNMLASIAGASLVGVDKSNQDGINYVDLIRTFKHDYNNRQMIYNWPNPTHSRNYTDWWYDNSPNMLYYILAEEYPNDTNMNSITNGIADKFYDMTVSLGGQNPNFWHQSYNHDTNSSVDASWKCPEGGMISSLVEYWAYKKTGNTKYLNAAKWGMNYYNNLTSNPYYEVGAVFAPYIAARMNAEQGTYYDINKYFKWVLSGSSVRGGWGTIQENWNGYDVYGLQGSRTDGGGYAFLMNTFATAFFAPVVKYDVSYANVVGKWLLNVSNAARFFYADQMPADNQYYGTKYQNAPEKVIGYEGLRKTENSQSPRATGDPEKYWSSWGAGDTCTDLGLYGSSWVGFFGAIFKNTNVDKILQIDLNALDFYKDTSYPSYLYYNPYTTDQSVQITLDSESDLFDAVSGQYIAKNVFGTQAFNIPASNSVVLVVTPPNGTLTYNGSKTLINNVPVAYTSALQNLALNKTVTVSSSDTYPASNAVDGNTVTRWASNASDLQWIYVDLGSEQSINRVKLSWEAAYGKGYKLQVSNNATDWTDVYSTATGDGGVDDISFRTKTARYVRMYGTQRATKYGYSLYEFEVYNLNITPITGINVSGAGNSAAITTDGGTLQMNAALTPINATLNTVTWTVCNQDGSATTKAVINQSGVLTAISNGIVTVKATSTDGTNITAQTDITISGQKNLAIGKSVAVSSSAGSNVGANAVDGITNNISRWESSATDPQWIYVDLGSVQSVGRVKLEWEAAYGKSYKIQVSNNSTDWTDVYSTTTGDGGIDDITFTPTTARYVRMYGTQRGTSYAYSIYEFRIYAPYVTGISITGEGNATAITTSGGSIQMNAAVTPAEAADKTVTWSVCNQDGSATDKAVIDQNGLLTAVSDGIVTVKAKANDGSNVTGQLDIEITGQHVEVTGVTLNKESGIMTVGDTDTLTATVSPSDATDKTVNFTSGDTGVATVTAAAHNPMDGTTSVTIQAVGAGDTTITAIAAGYSDTYTVHVNAATPETVTVTGITLNKKSGIMTVGDTDTLTATVSPSDATDKTVNFTSGDTGVATVSAAAYNPMDGTTSVTIQAVGAGDTTITAIAAEYSDTYAVHVAAVTTGKHTQAAPAVEYTKQGDWETEGVTVTITKPTTGASYSTDNFVTTVTNPIYFPAGTTSAAIYVRLDETDVCKQSETAKVEINFLKQDQPAPDIRIETVSDESSITLTVVASGGRTGSYEYRIDDTDYTDLPADGVITGLTPGKLINLFVRSKGNAEYNSSPDATADIVLPKYKNSATVAITEANFSIADTSITMITAPEATSGSTIEYSFDGEPYVPLDRDNLPSFIGLEPGSSHTISVRAAEDAVCEAGSATTVVISTTYTQPGNDDGDEDDGSGTKTPDVNGPTITPKTAVSNGTTTARLSAASVLKALASAEHAAKGTGKAPEIVLDVASGSKTDTVAVTIPANAFKEIGKSPETLLTIKAGDVHLTFSDEALSAIGRNAGGDIVVTAGRTDESKLTDEQRRAVQGRPVYSLSVTSGDTKHTDFEGNVRVSLPYTLKPGEDPNTIVIYYVDGKGNLRTVENSVYDPEIGRVTFTTVHFSEYMIGYNPVEFRDVPDSHWGKEAIGFAAARGLVQGTGSGLYSPDRGVTRAEIVQMVQNVLKLPEGTDAAGYSDVAADQWYYKAVMSLKSAGLLEGLRLKGDSFKPAEAVTREEMAVILANAAAYKKADASSGKIDLSERYRDYQSMEKDYLDEIETVAELGLMRGTADDMFSPESTVTRAQAAQVQMKLLQLLYKN